MTNPHNLAEAPIESWKVEDVKPYPLNHKKHPPKHIEQLALSIKTHGLNDPITVDGDGVIISGHGRLEAVKKNGWEFVPVRQLKDLTPGQADALRIAANKTSSQEYDYDILQTELNRLFADGEDIAALGFDDKELSMMMDDVGELASDIVSDDISFDVEQFEEKTREEAEAVKSSEETLGKLLGFNKMPAKTKKTAIRFMTLIEEETGQSGAEAFQQFIENYVTERS